MKRVMLGMAMACALASAGSTRAQQPDEREAVKAAALDYVEAIYQAQPTAPRASTPICQARLLSQFRRTTFTSELDAYQSSSTWPTRNNDGKRPITDLPKTSSCTPAEPNRNGELTSMWGVDTCPAKYEGK